MINLNLEVNLMANPNRTSAAFLATVKGSIGPLRAFIERDLTDDVDYTHPDGRAFVVQAVDAGDLVFIAVGSDDEVTVSLAANGSPSVAGIPVAIKEIKASETANTVDTVYIGVI